MFFLMVSKLKCWQPTTQKTPEGSEGKWINFYPLCKVITLVYSTWSSGKRLSFSCTWVLVYMLRWMCHKCVTSLQRSSNLRNCVCNNMHHFSNKLFCFFCLLTFLTSSHLINHMGPFFKYRLTHLFVFDFSEN